MSSPAPLAEIDRYIAALDGPTRSALERLRVIIRSAAPDAEECLSNGIPSLRWNGMLVAFGAASGHCVLYLLNENILFEFADEIRNLDATRSTIRFTPEQPLTKTLVRNLVRARMEQNAALHGGRRR